MCRLLFIISISCDIYRDGCQLHRHTHDRCGAGFTAIFIIMLGHPGARARSMKSTVRVTIWVAHTLFGVSAIDLRRVMFSVWACGRFV